MNIEEELRRLVHQSGGSFESRSDRINKAILWAGVFSTLNIQNKKVEYNHEKQIRQVIDYRKDYGIILRTLTNDMAAMRVMLRQSKRHQFANSEYK